MLFLSEEDEEVAEQKKPEKAPRKTQGNNAGKPQEEHKRTDKQVYRTSTPSIKEALKQKQAGESRKETQQEPAAQEMELKGSSQAVFTQEELTLAWDAFAESIKNEYPRMYSTIKNNAPDYKEDFQLQFALNNKGQQEDFTVRIKPILLNYLRKELNNYTIDIVVNYAQEADNDKKNILYTAEDKFKYLSEKNPLLAKLKQQFNLDFE